MALIQEAKRRGVLRVAIAYLAIAWLVLQVVDVVADILLWPNWAAQLALVTLALGFPVALLLAWFYDVTPTGVIDDTGDADIPAGTHFGRRRIDVVIIAALSLVVLLLLVKDRIVPTVDDSIPMVTDYMRITDSQIIMPPTASPYPMVPGKASLYFNTFETGHMTTRRVSMTGGEVVPFTMPATEGRALFRPTSALPDGTGMAALKASDEGGKLELQNWIIPFVGGSPKLLGDGYDAVFSPDGTRVAYFNIENDLMMADADGQNERLVSLNNSPRSHWIEWSPDGTRIRFLIMGSPITLWEVDADAENATPTRVFPELTTSHCCGRWTPDGQYFVFQGTIDEQTNLYAVREGEHAEPTPVQITSGALGWRRPTIAPDGKSLFAIGWQLRGETVAMDPDSGRLTPLAITEDLSAEWLSIANDADRMAWVSYPEGDLWSSRRDGSERVQLTFGDLIVRVPDISPDGRSVVFTGKRGELPWGVYVVAASGGEFERINPPDMLGTSGDWSPDGTRILYFSPREDALQVYELASKGTQTLPNTEKFFRPSWSPSGNKLMAYRTGRGWLALYDLETQEKRMLLEDRFFENAYWANDDSVILVVDPHIYGADRGIYQVDTETGDEELIMTFGNKRLVGSELGMWVGFTPEGEPMFLRDQSIHHIYKLAWLP